MSFKRDDPLSYTDILRTGRSNIVVIKAVNLRNDTSSIHTRILKYLYRTPYCADKHLLPKNIFLIFKNIENKCLFRNVYNVVTITYDCVCDWYKII